MTITYDNSPVPKDEFDEVLHHESQDEETKDAYDDPQEEASRLFACPFYKLDPCAHAECLHLKLKRISYVKQHLNRRHVKKGDFSCPRCQSSFPTSEQQREHQSKKCHSKRRSWDELGPQATERLKFRSNRTLSVDGQWYDIWDALFPDTPQPKSPYLDTMWKETLGIIQHRVTRQDSHIISDFLQSRDKIWNNDSAMYRLLVDFVKHMSTLKGGRRQRPDDSPKMLSTRTSTGSDYSEADFCVPLNYMEEESSACLDMSPLPESLPYPTDCLWNNGPAVFGDGFPLSASPGWDMDIVVPIDTNIEMSDYSDWMIVGPPPTFTDLDEWLRMR
ncbi:hypothetical protein VHEMI08841 [[Torrubiella] hemipterigena]|uniref:C2H2-type domain-containing protein n=1 Tax=[Torrubiella] hemipterigena TaxID=1531966 RepID=A0A0A1TES4_9HYPO|nr:hypothetical protein VHEMI08841 [[Torrubiella] hemipterigena]